MYNVQFILLHKYMYKLFQIVNFNLVKYLTNPDKKFNIKVPLLIFNEYC